MKLSQFRFFLYLGAFLGGAFTLPLSASADRVEYFAKGEEARQISFGSGADGDFNDGPTQTGITVVGAAITVNTNVKSVYEFSSFSLGAGVTLTATGSYPLLIRVTGTTTIQGTLQSNGSVGGNAAAASPTATGGAGGAGGGRGGIGGERSPNTSAGVGEPTSGTEAIGGGILPNDAAASTQYSGGGGCHGRDPAFLATDGIHPADGTAGGAAGACTLTSAEVADRFETLFSSSIPGGAGGGGGSTQALLGNGINGAGGGGGGGAIHIASQGNLTLSGTLRARGGAGGVGSPGVTDYGSSGGGGSGGSIWIQTAGTFSGAGTLDVTGGAGGTDGGSIGGDGSRGVIRTDSMSSTFAGTVSPAGSVDQAYTVLPVTTEFTLSGGPACGTITSNPSHESANRNSFLALVFFFALYYSISRAISRLRGRLPN